MKILRIFIKFTQFVALIKPNKMVETACPGKFAFKSYGVKCAKKLQKKSSKILFMNRFE